VLFINLTDFWLTLKSPYRFGVPVPIISLPYFKVSLIDKFLLLCFSVLELSCLLQAERGRFTLSLLFFLNS
jgi:hypothetical protein